MTAGEAVAEIRRRAGIKKRQIPVVFVQDGIIPPTLRDAKGRIARNKTLQRQVVVSVGWLRERAPKLWAAFVAARLDGAPPLPITKF